MFFAFGIADFFGPIYLLKLGYSLSQVALYWLLFSIIRLLIRPYILNFCHRFGSKTMFIFAVTIFSFRYTLYAELSRFPSMIVLVLFFESIASTLYWLLYHSTFAAISHSENTGKQVAWRDFILLGVKLISPICIAFSISHLGFETSFLIATVISLLSIFPLIKMPIMQRQIPRFSWKKLLVTDKAGFCINIANGISEYGHGFLWKIILFLTVGKYLSYGGLMSLSIFFQMMGSLVVGHRFDKGKGYLPAIIGLAFIATAVIGRAFLDLTITTIISLDLIMVAGAIVTGPIFAATIYTRSRKSGNPLWFQTLTESGWDIGAIISLSFTIFLLSFNFEIRNILPFALVGLFGSAVALSIFKVAGNKMGTEPN